MVSQTPVAYIAEFEVEDQQFADGIKIESERIQKYDHSAKYFSLLFLGSLKWALSTPVAWIVQRYCKKRSYHGVKFVSKCLLLHQS